jgi:hypothetical protein
VGVGCVSVGGGGGIRRLVVVVVCVGGGVGGIGACVSGLCRGLASVSYWAMVHTFIPFPTHSHTRTHTHLPHQETNRYLNQSVTSDDLIAAWSGLRPLVKARAAVTASMHRYIHNEHIYSYMHYVYIHTYMHAL